MSSGLGEILVKHFAGRVLGDMATPKGFLGTIQTIPLAKILRNLLGYQSLHRIMFSGPPFSPKKGSQAFLGQDVGPGLQKWGPGSKISKLRVEKPCRIQWSMPQTGPYVASDGQKLFWGGGPQLGGGFALGEILGGIQGESWGNPGEILRGS